MLKKIGEPAPPKGWKLKLFRAPLFFYRYNLGFLMGKRFIHLKHWGRKSGNLNETVIEVIDQDKASGKIFSASGFGDKAQWYKNIVANNAVFITMKNTAYEAQARVLSADEATEVLSRYAIAHPKAIIGVAKLSGYAMDGTQEDVVEFSQIVKIVEFTPSRDGKAE